MRVTKTELGYKGAKKIDGKPKYSGLYNEHPHRAA